jgi:Zn-dependent peptidase ImmA (M78 family)
MLQSEIKWTNKSVLKFEKESPVEKIISKVGEIIIKAFDSGMSGPPYDPSKIASYMGVKVLPNHDVPDARLISAPNGKFLIEYNPNQYKSRIRFSIAHELTHLLFPDCEDEIRNRNSKVDFSKDNWQLEMLCNIGASEFLMPIGSFPGLKREEITIGNFINLRDQYNVSTEALFLRAVKVTEVPCFIFCATRINPNASEPKYGIDYIVGSKSWSINLPKKITLPTSSIVNKCTAVGYAQIADEIWIKDFGLFHVECIGIPAFPNHRYPRVMGIVTKAKIKRRKVNKIKYLFGDATNPKVKGNYIIAHVVNDKALRWGGRGFAKSLKEKHPSSAKHYLYWTQHTSGHFKLGNIHSDLVDNKVCVISMVAQKGYGVSKTPRIRYAALKLCLEKTARMALENSASVHMPRIGCGQAGGAWDIVSELIETKLCDKGVKVFIYDLQPDETLSLFE